MIWNDKFEFKTVVLQDKHAQTKSTTTPKRTNRESNHQKKKSDFELHVRLHKLFGTCFALPTININMHVTKIQTGKGKLRMIRMVKKEYVRCHNEAYRARCWNLQRALETSRCPLLISRPRSGPQSDHRDPRLQRK
jgi:hypothetical protein